MTERIILASLAARTTFMEVVPSDESRTLAFAAGFEADGACFGEPVKGVVLLKKGASSQGPLEDDGASAEDDGALAGAPAGDREGS